MPDNPTNSGLFKELRKDKFLYVIAITILSGAYLMDGESVGPTWYVGCGLISIGIVLLISRFLVALFEGSFKRNYTDVIAIQKSTIKSQNSVIREYGKSMATASATTNQPTTIASGYQPFASDEGTSTSRPSNRN